MKQYTFRNAAATWWAEYWTDGMATTDNQRILSIRSMSVGGTINHTDLDDTMIALGLPNKVGVYTTEIELKALATALNLNLSMIVDAAASVSKYAALSVQTTPTFSPVAGDVVLGATVTISSASADAIYYTKDGSIPTTASTRQSVTPCVVSSLPATVRALAVRAGYYQSVVGSAAYTQSVTANLASLVISNTPTGYTFAGGTYTYDGVVVLNAVSTVTVTPTGAGVITVNGVEVTSGAASGAIALTAGETKVITVVVTETNHLPITYTINLWRNADVVGTPAFSTGGGAIALGTLITITSAGADSIYYTVDGTTPDNTKTLYTAPVEITEALTLKAIGLTEGWDDSAVTTASYTQAVATAPASATLAGGSSQAVPTITGVVMPAAGGTDETGVAADWVLGLLNKIKFTVVAGATGTSTITINGAAYTSGADYTITAATPLVIVVTTTEAGKSTAVRTFNVLVTAAAAQTTPTFSPAAGAVDMGATITIVSAGADAIYYTTNGDTPTINSTRQSVTPCVFAGPMTIKALAVKAGKSNSAIGSAAYTQAIATAPSAVHLTAGDGQPVGGVTDVAIPANGATDNTGKITGWATGTADKVKFTVTDATGTSTITINTVPYTSGDNYTVPSTITRTVVVTTTEANKVTAVRTFTIDVAAV